MKDQLDAGPVIIATSNAIISAPIVVAWLAGLLRDVNGGGSIDRFFVGAGALLATSCYAFLAANVPDLRLIVAVAFVASAGLVLAKTSAQAVMSQGAQHTHTEDRAGAVWNIVETLPTVASYAIGPVLLRGLGPSGFFLVCGCLASLGLLVGFAAVGRTEAATNGQPAVTARGLKQLLFAPSYALALLVIFLFAIQPGWQTPILFYLTKVVGLSQIDYGRFWVFSSVFVIIGCTLYRVWARSASERILLRAATLLMVLQSPAPLLISDSAGAYPIAALSGLMYGFGIAAYWSLLIRSIPFGLHGAGYMVAVLVSVVGIRGGDIAGSWMLEHYGYVIPFVITTLTTALIAPTLLVRRLTVLRAG